MSGGLTSTPVVLGITHQLGWRIEPHRLRVEQRGQEHLGMMALHPRRGVSDEGKGRGMALGEAVGAEAFKLFEGALGELGWVAVCDHALHKLVMKMLDAIGEFEGSHGAPKLIRL